MKKLKYAVGFLLMLSALAVQAEGEWHLLVEPAFLHNPVSWPIQGSKTTVLVPARLGADGTVQPMTESEARTERVTQEGMLKAAPAAAEKVLKTLKPEYIRGPNNVIEYAVLQSESPFTASTVLATDFAEIFADTLGPDILVAIPNRNRLFVFPKLSQGYKALADFVIGEYESSPNPVSKEVFQVRDGKLIAIGSYR